jgi:hypothetical protein
MQEPDFLDLLVQISKASPTFSLVTFLCFLGFLLISLILIRKRSKQKSIEKKLTNHQSSHQGFPRASSVPSMQSSVLNMDISELLDIEEALFAIRELYHRKLINADIYVDQSMKHSERIRA